MVGILIHALWRLRVALDPGVLRYPLK